MAKMFLLFALASVLVHAASAAPTGYHEIRYHSGTPDRETLNPRSGSGAGRDPMVFLHEKWMSKHKVDYTTEAEKFERLDIFKQNAAHIMQHNTEDHSFKLGLNRFADMSYAEYKAYVSKLTGVNSYRPMNNKTNGFNQELRQGQRGRRGLPSSIDWRDHGAVGAVKDQGQCGCCWAFSSIASVEGLHALKTGDLVTLSEQVLIDCDNDGVNQGCGGGNMGVAFDYMIKNGGVPANEAYPDIYAQGSCQPDAERNVAASVASYVGVTPQDENELMQAVSRQPVSAAVDSSCPNFGMYSGGIFTEDCGNNLGHAVTIVGYGTDKASGTPYWLVKNSWSEHWGENGYMRLARSGNGAGLCGINLAAVYPTA